MEEKIALISALASNARNLIFAKDLCALDFKKVRADFVVVLYFFGYFGSYIYLFCSLMQCPINTYEANTFGDDFAKERNSLVTNYCAVLEGAVAPAARLSDTIYEDAHPIKNEY